MLRQLLLVQEFLNKFKFGDSYKSNSAEEADLFSSFFYEQFSERSKYDIRIDHNNSHYYVIDLNSSSIFSILRNINPSKAMGPNKIHGLVLKTVLSTFQNFFPFYSLKVTIW